MGQEVSYPRDKIKILLLEGIHPTAARAFEDAGYSVDLHASAMSESELLDAVPTVHLLGIRSKTKISPTVIENAKRLIGIGCFCIGTNQVALDAAECHGVPVFNAPFSNTRSVAELTMAEIVMLARKAAHRSSQVHAGVWQKSAKGCHEVRHKTVGIVGYGHIGPQVGLLAEAFGMSVLFYDHKKKLPLGNARPCTSLQELLTLSDFVTLHVPETAETRNMIAENELRQMKRGSFLLNLSRGTVVDIAALRAALDSRHLAGAAVDVYPKEPKSNDEVFTSPLQGAENVILTPHIGGSTEEAQENIGLEVALSLLKALETGTTGGAVNFPQIDLPVVAGSHRILNVHKNVPGVLSSITGIVSKTGANINAQYLSTTQRIGYLIMDVGPEVSHAIKEEIEALDTNIRTRLLF